MKIKKYIAPTMPEAMKQIRQDFGTDGVILNSKKIRIGGFLGFFTKPGLEIIAAYDPDPLPASKSSDRNEPYLEEPGFGSAEPATLSETINRERQDRMQQYVPPAMAEPAHLAEPIEEISDWMTEQGFQTAIKAKVLEQLLRFWYREDDQTIAIQSKEKWLHQILLNLIEDKPFGSFDYSKKYLNLIGPTGVGKTTTIAKIAADAVLNKKKKAAMITTDTYRIAAIDQLKTYAEILDIPLEIAYNHEDFKKAKERFDDYDVIFVDSAGRNFKNKQYVDDLKEIIQFDSEMENYLVLSMTSKYTDMIKITQQFTNIPIRKLIFTKKDETSTYGDLFNIVNETGFGIAYVTTGQNVPDDITEATQQNIVTMVMGDRQHA